MAQNNNNNRMGEQQNNQQQTSNTGNHPNPFKEAEDVKELKPEEETELEQQRKEAMTERD